MKKFFKEFKDFINKGNVIDLAVGVIIGAAFKDVVTALVEKIITPILNCFGAGGADEALGALQIQLPGKDNVIDFGSFISSIISFLLMALIVFMIVKAVRKASTIGKKKKEEAPTTKTCPFCKSEIDIEATRCPHCTSEQPVEEEEEATEETEKETVEA